jgi:signal transduction histidine kinase/purine-cytosine permease-like protein/ActR/RegA family two-component response regulator
MADAAASAESASPPQRIVPIRREYNAWVADETIEDYALRYTPRSFRKWSEFRVANTALGATSFLALEAIGASVALDHGFFNAFWAIVLVGVFIFVTGVPVSLYAARHAVDIDLLTRGSGFGYLGSTFSSLVYASFTFIFFSLEASIMASALELGLGIPLWLGYLICSVVVIPLVMYGITTISRLQAWTQPLWLVLLVLPYAFLLLRRPAELQGLMHASYGINDGHFDALRLGAAGTVVASMVAQIGQQVDSLRFMPPPRPGRAWRWWLAVIAAGPGWILVGGAKMLGGAVLAYLAVRQGMAPSEAVKPTQMYLAGFAQVTRDPAGILLLTCLFVTVSQIKINVNNAYAGSLAWSNFFARLTHAHPGRLVWLVFNVLIGVALIKVGIFDVLEGMLGFYANFAVAWIGALVADLVINKPLGLSPPGIEFRRAYLHDVNPVGFVAMGLGTLLALSAFVGAFGPMAQAFSTGIGFAVAFCCAPLVAWLTEGRYYIARPPAPFPAGQSRRCGVCQKAYEVEDMARCPAYGCDICSLCCSLDARCQDVCKPSLGIVHGAADALRRVAPRLLKVAVSRRVHYLACLLGLALVLGVILSFIVAQEAHVLRELAPGSPALWHLMQIKIACALVLLVVAIGSCWLLLTSDSRRVAQDESNRQALLLREEIRAHEVTDEALQAARRVAEMANQAKTRFITTISHELRTPLNSMLGYAQIMERDLGLPPARRAALEVIRKSGGHVVSLIDGLLDIARIEAGRLTLVQSEIRFEDFLAQLADIFELEARNKGIAFAYELSTLLPPAVRGDRKRLAQLLINLLGNAVKYTARGRVAFRIRYASEIATFEIEDTGPGIAEADLERVFLPFERAGEARRAQPGVGLGLTISNVLTRLMGGDLSLRSTVGQGSCFTVRLFLPSVAAPREPVDLPAPHRVTGYAGPARRVLVVDDAAVDRQLLCDVLEPIGFAVLQAATGVEALQEAGRFMPDLILLDIDMPGIDGWETARLLRANAISMAPILIVSANAFVGELHNDVGVEREDFLIKPLRIDDLLERVRARLDLVWTGADAPARSDAPPGAPAPRPLPADSHASLQQLGDLGYVRGILEKLDEIDRLDAAYAPVTSALRGCVQRFDLAGFARLLEDVRA